MRRRAEAASFGRPGTVTMLGSEPFPGILGTSLGCDSNTERRTLGRWKDHAFMINRFSKLIVAVGLAAAIMVGAVPKPAQANEQQTINTALGAAALIGGLILYNNYQHKRQAANRVVGYTRNGGTIYGDGRIVMPNGQTIYPNSYGQYPWGQTAYYNPGSSGYGYDYDRDGRYDNTGRHRGHAYAYGHYSHPARYRDWDRGRGHYVARGHDRDDRGRGHGRGHDKHENHGHDKDH